MRFFNLILASIYVQLNISAGPVQARRDNDPPRLERRHQRSSWPAVPQDSDINDISAGISHVDLKGDDAESGFLYGAYVSSVHCTSVTGTIVIPTVSVSSATAEYVISAWVSLDEIAGPGSSLQVGLDIYVESGTVGSDVWYEWYPDYA